MQQYNRIKSKYPDALLLFRVGDFYETFGQDAITAARVLGIVQTKRSNGAASETELAGFPHHALDTYLPKLVRAGYRVAICDQLEDPKRAKTIVKRGVTELITPGVALNDQILDIKSNNFLASVFIAKEKTGVAFIDISTGEFLAASGDDAYIQKLLHSFDPAEVIVSKPQMKEFGRRFGSSYYSYQLDEWVYSSDYALETLLKHFQVKGLKGFGISKGESEAIVAAGAALHYLRDTEHKHLQHIRKIVPIPAERFVWLDPFSVRNLELLSSPNPGAKTLLDILDRTISPMGGRLLKRWITLPLKDPIGIQERLDIVTHWITNPEDATRVRKLIEAIGDIERIASRIPNNKINPREVKQLQLSLEMIPELKSISSTAIASLQKISDLLDPCTDLRKTIGNRLQDEPPALASKGEVIRDGVSPELDELRSIIRDGKTYIIGIQQRAADATGIPSLKVGFNNVFGYYLEVRNSHKDKVPEGWIRKQTLTNAERYITEELKVEEQKILGAGEQIQILEERLYLELVEGLLPSIPNIQVNAEAIAELDCLLAFAQVAVANRYVRPEISDGRSIEIRDGRHPVIEKQLPPTEEYIPNDVFLDPDTQQMLIITGPNMSGKSAVLRQTALIVLMAQIGSFVPATHAHIGWVDKIFTRVGASDNISSGESTFMVEMNETASIVNNMTDRSLILLDEIGRGTSTYDGISIAWSLAEYLHNHPTARPKTLFATHYHELNELADKCERIHNYRISTRESGNKVIFLRKLVEGGSKHSFGIHVARMAGMPSGIVNRAKEILHQLEQKSVGNDLGETLKQVPISSPQLSFFESIDPATKAILDELQALDVNTMTPVEALMKLQELRLRLEK